MGFVEIKEVLGFEKINQVIIDGENSTLTINDKVYNVGYGYDQSSAQSGVAEASIFVNTKPELYIACGDNLEEIKQIMHNEICYVSASKFPYAEGGNNSNSLAYGFIQYINTPMAINGMLEFANTLYIGELKIHLV